VVPKAKPARTDDLTVDDNARRFAICRSLGHSWKHQPRREVAWDGTPVIVSICTDCATERRRDIPRSGAYVPPRYKYPDGYQRKGDDKLTTVQWRRVLIVGLG
jgi:hypothetical protein